MCPALFSPLPNLTPQTHRLGALLKGRVFHELEDRVLIEVDGNKVEVVSLLQREAVIAVLLELVELGLVQLKARELLDLGNSYRAAVVVARRGA